MPNYKSDLEWLRVAYPHEYDKIPTGLPDNSLYKQVHCSAYESPDGPVDENDEGRWCIVFASKATGLPDDQDLVIVLLDMARPSAEDDTIEGCPFHTLRVSRDYCPQHKNL